MKGKVWARNISKVSLKIYIFSQFWLLTVATFYKVTANAELVTTKLLLPQEIELCLSTGLQSHFHQVINM